MTDHTPQEQALLNAIAEQRKTDPLIGLKIGAQDLCNRLFARMATPQGVHIESVITALSALGGFSCQMLLREFLARDGKHSTAGLLMEVATDDGKTYYFGDPLNQFVAESPYSFWAFVAGGAQHLGCDPLPDVNEMFEYCVKAIGDPSYGKPRVPDVHAAGDTAENYARELWLQVIPTLRFYCETPQQWPMLFGIAVQHVMTQGKDVLPPDIAVRIAMETAIAASKIAPGPAILNTLKTQGSGT